jgi:hypothetical protein
VDVKIALSAIATHRCVEAQETLDSGRPPASTVGRQALGPPAGSVETYRFGTAPGEHDGGGDWSGVVRQPLDPTATHSDVDAQEMSVNAV